MKKELSKKELDKKNLKGVVGGNKIQLYPVNPVVIDAPIPPFNPVVVINPVFESKVQKDQYNVKNIKKVATGKPKLKKLL